MKKSVLSSKFFVSCVFVFMFVFSFGFVSSIDVDDSDVGGVRKVVIDGAENLYAYEVTFEYDGSIEGVDFADFLGSGAGVTQGYKTKGTNLSVYESRLDSSATGITGTQDLFNVSYSGDLTLKYALFIMNDSSEETAEYNVPVDDSEDTEDETTGGGGGGAAVTTTGTKANISLDEDEINLDIVINSKKERTLVVTNLGNSSATVTIGLSGLQGIVKVSDNSFELEAGESKEIVVTFLPQSEGGIKTGKIKIGGKEVFVAVNVRTKPLLFDAMIVVPDSSKKISLNDKLNAQVTLIPMGDNPYLDVTVNYLIKDFNGNIHLKESETLLVDEQKSFKKQFYTKDLPAGNYILGLELIYPNGVATSSSHFQIQDKISEGFKGVLVFLIGGIFVLVGLIVWYVVRVRRKRKSLLKKNRKR